MRRAIFHAPSTVLGAVFVALLTMTAVPTHAAQQPKPLSEQEVLELLAGGVSSSRVSEIVDERGIDFDFTPQAEQKVREAGGADDVVSALRRASQRRAESQRPHTGALALKTSPGEAQVYLNDEFKGMTSPKGDLRMTDLPPGTYNLRVSLMGYQSYEGALTVAAGQDQTVYATLVQKSPVAPPKENPPPVQAPPTPTSGIPIPGLKIEGLQFYEGPHDTTLPPSQRVYRFSFDRFTARSIYWELDLTFPAPPQRIDFNLEVVWYKPGGSELTRQPVTAHVESTWHSSWHTRGFGFVQPGHWIPGTYRVDVYFQSMRIASATFQIL